MKNERIGNDINIAWGIKSGDSPFPLEGKNVTLYLHHPYGKQKVEGFRLEGNKVIWTFKGADQKYVGKYGLTLVVNEGADGMITTDSCDFVNLVACSCQVGGEDNDGVQTEAIELTSTLGFIAYDDTEIREELSRLETDKADKSELTELSEEVSELSEKVGNLPSGESSVFEAVYGVTTYDEIVEQYNANKHVVVKSGDDFLSLVKINKNQIDFTSIVNNNSTRVSCFFNGTWASYSYTLEWTSNKTKTISEASTDTQYPSAKAVYEALQNVGGESDVFVAIKDETTYEEIVAAKEAGKVVVCYGGSNAYILLFLTSSSAFFYSHYSTFVYELICNKSSAKWSSFTKNNEHELKTLTNGNAQIKIAGKTAEVVTPQNVGKQGVISQTQTWTQAADKSYSYVMSDIVRGAIPQANMDLFLQFEKVSFNEQTGYFEIGDLTDISYEEMLKIYKTQIVTVDLSSKWLSKRVRTTISNLGGANVDNGGAQISIGNAWNTSYVESIDLLEITSPTAAFRVKGAGSAFMRASRLKEIRNIMRFDLDNPYTSNDFVECYSLESIRAVLSAKDFSFKDSARLTYESVKYMIGKSKPATKITLTLHATALANAETAYLADAEQDLATYPTLSDWALSKNIQIATA